MKKASKILFVAALIAMVMALTSCGGLSDDLTGVYAPVKVIYTLADGTEYTETINWNNNTFSSTKPSQTGWNGSYAYWHCNVYDVGKSTAKLAEPMTNAEFAAANGVKNITWYGSNQDRKVKKDGNNLKINYSSGIVNDMTFKPSDNPSYKWVYEYTFSSTGNSIKAYYNIFK